MMRLSSKEINQVSVILFSYQQGRELKALKNINKPKLKRTQY